MSASEKLKALDARRKAPVASISPSVRELVDALPQIVAVVTEQENFNENMWTVQNGDDGEPFVSQEGLRYLRDHLKRSDAALAALEEALS